MVSERGDALTAARPRLLVLASTYPAHTGDGVPAFVEDLVEAQASDFDVTVVVPQVPGACSVEVSPKGVQVRRFRYFPEKWEDLADGAIIENLRAKPSRWLQVVPLILSETIAVARACHHDHPDAIHAHWIIPQGLVATVAAPRVPRMVTSLGGDLYALRAKPLRMLKAFVVRGAAALTAVNSDMAREIIMLGAEPSKVSVIPMGADLSRFNTKYRPPATQGHLRILFVGRLVEKKGASVLLDALQRLDRSDFSVTIVGGGPLEEELKGRAEGLPVTFLGQRRRDDLATDYLSHDVIVVPSVPAASGDQDGLPVALLEAMGSGCAVVASDLPGINEAVVHGESGILVRPGDAGELADAFSRIRSSPALLASLSRGAAERAIDYSVEATSRRYSQLLHSIIGR